MNSNEARDEEAIHVLEKDVEQLVQSLPKATTLNGKLSLVNYQGFWIPLMRFNNILRLQSNFHAHDSDIIITSHPKTGTTWLKSLLFTIVNRDNYPLHSSPLHNHSPHELVRGLENHVYNNEDNNVYPRLHQLDEIISPRLFSTHSPYNCLPHSIKASKCRVLYISRNPFDTFVSQWRFYEKMMNTIIQGDPNNLEKDCQNLSMEDYFEDFCEGRIPHGPLFDHVNGFWKWSIEPMTSNKVLFLKYEDLKDNPTFWLKKLAEFVGYPFSHQEETQGVIQEIVEFCSINNLKDLEGNKHGKLDDLFDKKDFYRKGEVGGWTKYFSTQMVERMNKLMEANFGGTGLSFDLGA